ncbi:MAG: hypothetical protein ABIQ12_08285 [Opitutaceae bacterium]
MRLLIFLVGIVAPAFAAVPPEFMSALGKFRPDPPPGWSFTQTTTGEGHSMVERSNATQPESARWSLLGKDGRVPTPDEARHYGDGRSLRSRGGTAPSLTDQLDLDSAEIVADDAERVTCRFRLRPGEDRDHTSKFLRAIVVIHKATRTFESIELANTGEFSPTFGVRIVEMNTKMIYSLPAETAPSLIQRVDTRMRGTAFWFKSLDSAMSVVFSDYARTQKH